MLESDHLKPSHIDILPNFYATAMCMSLTRKSPLSLFQTILIYLSQVSFQKSPQHLRMNHDEVQSLSEPSSFILRSPHHFRRQSEIQSNRGPRYCERPLRMVNSCSGIDLVSGSPFISP